MLPQIVSQSTEYAQEIAVLVAQMPVEQAMQVYDFVLDLQMRGANIPSNAGNGKRLNGSATPMELDHEEKIGNERIWQIVITFVRWRNRRYPIWMRVRHWNLLSKTVKSVPNEFTNNQTILEAL